MRRLSFALGVGLLVSSAAFAAVDMGEARMVRIKQSETALLGTYLNENCNIDSVKLSTRTVSIDERTDAVIILTELNWRGELPCPKGFQSKLPVELNVPSKADRIILYIPSKIQFSYPK